MKRYIYLAILMGLTLFLGSCWPTAPQLYPPIESWLCSINADGTDFRKIKKVDTNFGAGFWDIYMTKDNRIVFYGEKLWISDTDTIRVEQITPDNITLWHLPPRLSQSPDGSKLYFAADKNIYQLSYPDYQLTKLTDQTVRWLRNPIVSDLGNYITYTSNGFGYPTKETEYMYWLNLITSESDIIPSPDTVSVNPYYSEVENYVYYEKVGVFRSRLDGSDRSVVDTQGGHAYPYTMFSISKDLNHITHNCNTLSSYYLRVYDKRTSTGINIPVKMGSGSYQYLGVMCKSVNVVFYISLGSPEKIHSFSMDTGVDNVVFHNNSNGHISEFVNVAPTWDGSKVYFYAYISER